MLRYILKRLLLIIPTLFGILTINFIIAQAAPGGPVEQAIARLKHADMDATSSISGAGGNEAGAQNSLAPMDVASAYRGAQGVDSAIIASIRKMYGFDKPPLTRYVLMMRHYLQFDFGKSFFRDENVTHLIFEKMPVSISLGLWTTLLVYLVSIPLGIVKAVRDGSHFDVWTSTVVIIAYAIPSFLFAILLIIIFAGGSYLHWFPLRGLVSDNWAQLSTIHKVTDYFWHITLPLVAMIGSGFASLTMLTKNSFLEEIGKQYVTTAYAKGLTRPQVLIRHVFRNAMLIVIAGFPAAVVRILFSSALIIEIIFSLDGMGLLSFEATLNRDYPVMFGTLYIFTLLGLVLNLIGDLIYVLVDPRIDFERRGV